MYILHMAQEPTVLTAAHVAFCKTWIAKNVAAHQLHHIHMGGRHVPDDEVFVPLQPAHSRRNALERTQHDFGTV